MSRLASSSPKPGKYRPSTHWAGPVNHSSPSPDTLMPNSTPLRHMAVTMELPSTSRATSRHTFDEGMLMLRK